MNSRLSDIILAAAVVLLFGLQATHTYVYLERLPLEDVAESVRSPYFWSHGNVINGISTSIGYYSLIAAAMKGFGFTVYMAKWVRLALQLLSLLPWHWC